ncbi:hypothetical protein LTR53_005135 [Teratosphaeriaceae sp. CCFEE 6253]|nr:hypothetical protein LTR53_005135 [Teratosphaeriaceae sp. CCFEE 6253]
MSQTPPAHPAPTGSACLTHLALADLAQAIISFHGASGWAPVAKAYEADFDAIAANHRISGHERHDGRANVARLAAAELGELRIAMAVALAEGVERQRLMIDLGWLETRGKQVVEMAQRVMESTAGENGGERGAAGDNLACEDPVEKMTAEGGRSEVATAPHTNVQQRGPVPIVRRWSLPGSRQGAVVHHDLFVRQCAAIFDNSGIE